MARSGPRQAHRYVAILRVQTPTEANTSPTRQHPKHSNTQFLSSKPDPVARSQRAEIFSASPSDLLMPHAGMALTVRPMSAVGELVRFPSVRNAPPLRCPRGHLMRAERIVNKTAICSCGRHQTWRCHCGAMTYEPSIKAQCDLLRRADAVVAGRLRRT